MPTKRATDEHTTANLLLHPVRMRVVVALAGGTPMTVQQLAAHLGDVPAATLYRHIGTLADAGVLVVVGERPVRGTSERTYALNQGQAGLGPGDLASASPDQLVQAFSTFVTTLITAYAEFLNEPRAVAGEAAWFLTPFHMTDEQFATFGAELQTVLERAMASPSGAGSRRRTLATILIPEASKGDRS
jgi:DNA-binding transcriptional ArsR family regulator